MSGIGIQRARIEQDARRIYARYLSGWAMDALALRRSGLDRPSVRSASAPAAPLRKAA